jgi:hypothetical protein
MSFIGLLATVGPSILVFTGTIELETHKAVMMIGMFIWFLTAPFYMKKKGS